MWHSWLWPFLDRRIPSAARLMSWGCQHAFAKANTGKTLVVQKGKLRLKEVKGPA